jgi:hypothetical protein
MMGTVTPVSNTESNVFCCSVIMLLPRLLCFVLYQNSNMSSFTDYFYAQCILKLINIFHQFLTT